MALQLLYPAASNSIHFIVSSSSSRFRNPQKCSVARIPQKQRCRCIITQSLRCSNSELIPNYPADSELAANDDFGLAQTLNCKIMTDFGNRVLIKSTTLLMAMICSLDLLSPSPAEAADPVQTYNCVMNQCRMELIRCIGDASCAANLTCLETCNNRPDETECLMRCGDLFENQIVDQFNTCVVSTKKCVPQKPDDGSYPVPAQDSTVQNFDPLEFKGKWYITSGLNPIFDTYDCQIQDFSSPSPHTVEAKLSWRIKTPDGGFFTRSTVQNLVQDDTHPGILHNHANELLHYEDEWYILSAQIENKADDFVFVYYRGKNDAWDGFGGAVVYTRSEALPASIVPQLSEAAKKVGLDFAKFQNTNNTCPAQVPLLERLERKALEDMLKMKEEFATTFTQTIGNTRKAFLSYLSLVLRDSQ